MTLLPNPNGQFMRLILPSNTRLDLTKQPNGTFTNTTQPVLRGAVLSTLPNGDHQLRFKDGTTWSFRSLFTYPDGSKVEFLIEKADRNGNRITIERSGHDITRIVDSAGRAITVTASNGRITQLQDPIGRTVTYTYGSNGRLASVTDPAGGVTSYTYDGANRILTITDARGITYIENFYGPSGRMLRQVQADGGEWRNRYQVQGAQVTGPGCPGLACPTEDSWENFQAGYSVTGGTVASMTVVDPEGHTQTHRFNNIGLPIERGDGLGQKTTLVRDAGNLVTDTIDPLGRKTGFTYDGAGNVTSSTDPAGNVTRFEYEPTYSRLVKRTDALGQVTIFSYDANGNLLSSTDPLGHITALAYNTVGQPISITNPLGKTTVLEYDDVGNLTATIDPLGNRTTLTYDAVSRLTGRTDPRGATTIRRYDALNRVTQVTDALAGQTALTYDQNGKPLTLTDAKGNTTAYTYDSMERPITRTDPLGHQESSTYDRNGNLITYTDRKGQVSTLTYDVLGRPVSAAYADGSQTGLIYDAVGRPIRATDSTTGTHEFAYDALDRLVQELTPQGTVGYTYDVLGRRTAMTTNGLNPVSYRYDSASRLTQVAQGSQVIGLDYDANGRRARLTYPNGVTTAYAYDDASRLTALAYRNALGPLGDLTYQYDPVGRRIAVGGSFARTLIPDPVASAAYDAANRQIGFGGKQMNFDTNGNVTTITDSSGVTSFTWDARNRLIGTSGPGGNAGFAYDVLDRRISKSINGVNTDYEYDHNDMIREVGGQSVTAIYLRSLTIDEAFIRRTSANEFYLTDALGSSLALTGDAGTVETEYTYEPFGRTSVAGTPSNNSLQYTGRENDGPGLYYYRARYYNPTFHRFIGEDPMRFLGGETNYYAYVSNNPIRFKDPLGLWAVGISFEASTINPFTSGGGGSYGINFEYTSSSGFAAYKYGTPNNVASVGFLPGVSATVNIATGNGDWTGLFNSGNGSFGVVTGGYFQSPPDQPDPGYFGVQAGVALGPPGLGFTTTNYSPLFE